MIALVFLAVLLALAVYLAATGAGPVGSITELIALSAVFLTFFLSGIHVGAALGILGLLADLSFASRPLHPFTGQVAWNASTNFVLVAMPLFILMGEILLRSGVSDRMYRTLGDWIGRVPGGLLHTNILSCALFSAISGSSVATAATIGSVALPYFEQESGRATYKPRIVLGSLCGGGALGQLIPPSIALIIYGLFTDTSVGKLYAGGFVAGMLVVLLCTLFILAYGLVTGTRETAPPVSWGTRLTGLVNLLPSLALMALVLGTIYLGIATPTEAAALGVVGALVLAVLNRRASWAMVLASVRATARTTSMMGLIILAAFILNYVLSRLGLPEALARTVTQLPLPDWTIMLIIILFYFALGTFMDGLAMMLTTLPVIFPVVVALGYDPIWFGVTMTMLIEMALISPPDGMVMYVVQGVRGRPGPITDVFMGVLPFMAIYALSVLLMLAFPGILLWLPSMMK